MLLPDFTVVLTRDESLFPATASTAKLILNPYSAARSTMARTSNWCLWLSATIGVVVVYLLFTLLESSSLFGFEHPEVLLDPSLATLQHRCAWKEGDPVVYHLKTKMGVNYDAGHWFHMAENFMVQHSILRSAHQLTNASEVFYSFDKVGFIGELNGITRLMVYLGTHCPRTSPQKLYYAHLSHLPWHDSHIREGSSVVLDHHSFDELQVADLSGPVAVSSSSSSSGGRGGASAGRVGIMGGALTSRRFSVVSKYGRWPAPTKRSGVASVSTSSNSSSIQSSSSGKSSTGAAQLRRLQAPVAEDTMGTSTASAVSVSGSVAPAAVSAGLTHDRNSQICAKYMGTIGGKWPTVQRGHWFPNAGDIESFRDSLRRACPPDAELLKTTAKTRTYKLVIYQRDLSRKLANEAAAVLQLQTSLGAEWEIEVLMHSSSRSPCMLMHHLYNADVLVTPHGFQSMLLLFLPRPAIIFEVFPYRYYKRGYGPFGGEYGVMHGGVMSPPTTWQTKLVLPYISTATCMESKMCREFSRNQDVILTAHGVSRLVAFIEQSKAQLTKQPRTAAQEAKAPRDFLYDLY